MTDARALVEEMDSRARKLLGTQQINPLMLQSIRDALLDAYHQGRTQGIQDAAQSTLQLIGVFMPAFYDEPPKVVEEPTCGG